MGWTWILLIMIVTWRCKARTAHRIYFFSLSHCPYPPYVCYCLLHAILSSHCHDLLSLSLSLFLLVLWTVSLSYVWDCLCALFEFINGSRSPHLNSLRPKLSVLHCLLFEVPPHSLWFLKPINLTGPVSPLSEGLRTALKVWSCSSTTATPRLILWTSLATSSTPVKYPCERFWTTMSALTSYSDSAQAASTSNPTSSTAVDDDPKKKKPAKRRKVNHACLYCRRSHMTCDEGRPCQRW